MSPRPIARVMFVTPFLLLPLLGACARPYVTPARGVALSSLTTADSDIAERMLRQPAAEFPARIALVRVQSPGYRSYSREGYGSGNYSVVTTREIETDEDIQRLERLPMISQTTMLNRMVIPVELRSDRELRLAASTLKADLLLAYSVDTSFRIDEHDVGPLRLITLGMAPTKEAIVTATASLALIAVRTGYVFALAEGTAREKQLASSWTRCDAVEESRLRAERHAFRKMLDEFEAAWKGVVEQYASRQAALTPS